MSSMGNTGAPCSGWGAEGGVTGAEASTCYTTAGTTKDLAGKTGSQTRGRLWARGSGQGKPRSQAARELTSLGKLEEAGSRLRRSRSQGAACCTGGGGDGVVDVPPGPAPRAASLTQPIGPRSSPGRPRTSVPLARPPPPPAPSSRRAKRETNHRRRVHRGCLCCCRRDTATLCASRDGGGGGEAAAVTRRCGREAACSGKEASGAGGGWPPRRPGRKLREPACAAAEAAALGRDGEAKQKQRSHPGRRAAVCCSELP